MARVETPTLRQVRGLAHRAERTRKERDEAIRAAHPTYSMRAIADAAGLSVGRVHEIVHAKDVAA